jgi:hypothetical protein
VALRKRYDFKGRGGCKEERRTLLRGGDSQEYRTEEVAH